ncbi:MAG: hypothetical protein HC860_07775 [Alkalinema sp. RU_4_3]|nr:hypothetical protein [Alkalinema sp. RU_4_3]
MTGPQDTNDALSFQRELDRMEELFIDSPHFFKRAIVHEEDFFDQLDMVRESLPEAFRQAEDVLRRREQILEEAERYAEKLVEDAETRAAQLLADSVIVRQAEFEAQKIRSQLNAECNAAQDRRSPKLSRPAARPRGTSKRCATAPWWMPRRSSGEPTSMPTKYCATWRPTWPKCCGSSATVASS